MRARTIRPYYTRAALSSSSYLLHAIPDARTYRTQHRVFGLYVHLYGPQWGLPRLWGKLLEVRVRSVFLLL